MSVAFFRERVALLGLDPEIREFDESTHTAAEAAAAIGCDVAAIVKSLVFEADGAPLLILASGPNRVDTDAVGARLGVVIGKADAKQVKRVTGYSIGGVPPLGLREPIRTVIDATLLRLPLLWAAAGSATAVFPIEPADLVRLTGGQVIPVA